MGSLLTAGPTREAINPIRQLTNRFSGRMGYLIAGAAARGTSPVETGKSILSGFPVPF